MKNIREKFTLPTYENRSWIKRFLARFRIITHERRAQPTIYLTL